MYIELINYLETNLKLFFNRLKINLRLEPITNL
jgi:hypothetical protein